MSTLRQIREVPEVGVPIEGDIVERSPRLERAIPLLNEKLKLEQDWRVNESSSVFFPAAPIVESSYLGPKQFSKFSILAMGVLIFAVVPIPVLALPIYRLFKRRSKKSKRIGELNREIRSILPVRYEPLKGDTLPVKYKAYIPTMFREGLLYQSLSSGVILNPSSRK